MRPEKDGPGSVKLFALVFGAYAVGALLSWAAFGATVGPAFFPPAGVTAAALLLTRRQRWPAVIAAAFLAEFAVDLMNGVAPLETAGYAVANTVEPLVGASLVRHWCGGTPDLRRRKDLVAFVAGSCLTGPLVGALIGGGTVATLYGVPFPTAVLHWFAGDAIGAFVVATPILLWPRQSQVVLSRPVETLATMLVGVGVSVWAFWDAVPPSMLVLPVLAWAALRLDMLGAALAGAVVALTANVMTVSGRGVFGSLAAHGGTKLVLAQVFIAVNVLAALLIAQEASARVRALRDRDVERRERIRLETLAQLSQQLSAALTPRDIGVALVAHIFAESGATGLNLGLVTPDGSRLDWVTMTGFPTPVLDRYGSGLALAQRTVSTDAARTGQPVLVHTPGEYAERYSPEAAEVFNVSGTQSVVGWPLKSGDTPIGVLMLAWPDRQALDAAQLAYVSAVATMVSQALVRARIYQDEHARAAVLQAAVLPDTADATPGLDVYVTYEPADLAQGVGGDWYDVMALPKNRTYFAVGDVVGHGLPAVEDMAQLRAAARTLAHLGLSTDRLLTELNGLTRDLSQGKFATMAVAIFDPAAGSLTYCLAGHPPLILRRGGGEVITLSDARGPVLGPLSNAGYTEGTVSIAPGDILVMYTDGLVERREAGISAGIVTAQQIIADWKSDDDLTRSCRALQDVLAPRPRPDDVCIVAVRFESPQPAGELPAPSLTTVAPSRDHSATAGAIDPT